MSIISVLGKWNQEGQKLKVIQDNVGSWKPVGDPASKAKQITSGGFNSVAGPVTSMPEVLGSVPRSGKNKQKSSPPKYIR